MRKLSNFKGRVFSCAASVLGVRSYLQFQRDLAAAEKRLKHESQFIETTVGPIVYGTAVEGPPVLVIHGAGGGFDQSLHTAKMFGDGFQWIAPSRFGYLGTPLPKEKSPVAQADAHAALLDGLDIERVPVLAFRQADLSSPICPSLPRSL